MGHGYGGDRGCTDGAQIAGDASADELAADCSNVVWCDSPGGEGTVCRQQPGCTQPQAETEGQLESGQVCGTPRCPWILVTLDGRRLDHVSCP
jgi:hypothetical protein